MKTIPAGTGTLIIHISDSERLGNLIQELKEAGFEATRTSPRSVAPSSIPQCNDSFSSFIEALSDTITNVYVFDGESEQFRTFRNVLSIQPAHHPTLDDVERRHILETLHSTRWQCKNTAKLLGIDRSTLYRKMKRYGISRKTTVS